MTNKPSPSVERRAYTTDEFRCAYPMSRSKLYLLMSAGDLEYRQFDNKRLIPVEAAETWFKRLPVANAAV